MEQIIINNRLDLYGENAKYKNYNLFIEAGAGAGKTETIINLIVSQLYDGVAPERIIAITFTNKATEELINRISSIISEKIKNENNTLSNEKILILQNALKNIYKMNVSTIHHFCNVILNENSYKAKLSFGLKLLEEKDEINRREIFYKRWFNSLNKNEIKEINVLKDDAFKALKSTYEKLCEQFDDVKINASLDVDYEQIMNKVFELYLLFQDYMGIGEINAYAQRFYDAFSDAYENINKKDYKEIFEECVNNDAFKTIRGDLKFKSNSKNKNDIKRINEDEIKPLLLEILKSKQITDNYNECKSYEVINLYAIKAWEAYKKARDRESVCNNQLIYETYKLLNENNDVKEKLAKKYDIIFVDEFQDTDKYQNKFIIDLALAIDKRKEIENKASTSIVLVGDPKQSIYGFRGADFDLFMATKNNFTSMGFKNAINVFLPDNYRSNEYILKWINDTYSFKRFYKDYEYENMILPANNALTPSNENNVLAGVYSYNFNSSDDKFKSYVRFVKELKENYQIFSRNNINEPLKPRKIKYSDFLILTTSHAEINQFIMAFNKADIKTLVSGEFDLGSSLAFNYIYRLLFYVLNKENNNRRFFEGDFNSVIYNEEKLNKIKEDVKAFSPYGKLLYIFNNIDLILDEFEDSDKELLKTIMEQVFENVSYDNNASATVLLNTIDELIHQMQDSELSYTINEDAIRIMNVHKAKGLTAEIVIIADSGSFKTDEKIRVYDNTIYLNNMSLFPNINDSCKISKEKEKLRLEYVESTRAKQVMVFESNINKKGQLFAREEEVYDLSNLNNYHIEVELPAIADDIINDDLNTKEIIANGFVKIDSSLSKSIYNELSPSLLEKKGPQIIPIVKYQRPANNIYGTIFHRAMELYIQNKNDNIENIVNRAINENITSINEDEVNNYKKYLIECALAVINLYQETNIFEVYDKQEAEFKFCDYDETLYGDAPTLMSGSIDLLLKNDNRTLIIDYKTDTNHYDNNADFESLLKMKYQNQLNTYKKIISKLDNISINQIEAKIIWLEEKDNKTIAHFVLI